MCRNVKEIVYAYDIFKTLREKWQAVYPVAAMTKDAYVYTQCLGFAEGFFVPFSVTLPNKTDEE